MFFHKRDSDTSNQQAQEVPSARTLYLDDYPLESFKREEGRGKRNEKEGTR